MSKEFLIELIDATVGVKVYFDDRPEDPSAHCWVAEYYVDGEIASDSQKADHDDMPRDPGAEHEAVQTATAHAKRLALKIAGRG